MIVVVPAPNNDNAPNVTVDDKAVVVVTVTSAMRRNAASPSST